MPGNTTYNDLDHILRLYLNDKNCSRYKSSRMPQNLIFCVHTYNAIQIHAKETNIDIQERL